jgi:hypothetical protein
MVSTAHNAVASWSILQLFIVDVENFLRNVVTRCVHCLPESPISVRDHIEAFEISILLVSQVEGLESGLGQRQFVKTGLA